MTKHRPGRDGRLFSAAVAGDRDILGLWAGSGGDGANSEMSVLTDLRDRGVKDVSFVACDELKRLPGAVSNVWRQAIVHIHQSTQAGGRMLSPVPAASPRGLLSAVMTDPSRATLRQLYRDAIEAFNDSSHRVMALAAERARTTASLPSVVEEGETELVEAAEREAEAYQAMAEARERLFGK